MADSEEDIPYEDVVDDPSQFDVDTTPTTTESEPEQTAPTEKAQRVVSAYQTSRNTGYPTGFTIKSLIFMIVMLLWAASLVIYFSIVHAYLVFTQQSPPAAFNGLTVANVPFYSAAGVAAYRSEVYRSFDYYVWMTDYLLLLLPPYAIGVLAVGVLFRERSVAAYGVYVVAILFGLLQLAKALYWTFVWAGWFGLSCGKYQFCLSHNPGEPIGTTTFQFVYAVIFAYVSAVLSFGIMFVQWIVKSARLYAMTIAGKALKKNGFNVNSRAFADESPLISLPSAKRRRAPPVGGGDSVSAPPVPPKTLVQFI